MPSALPVREDSPHRPAGVADLDMHTAEKSKTIHEQSMA